NPTAISFTDKFDKLLEEFPRIRLLYFEMQDKSMARRMEHYVRTRRLRHHVIHSPMFLTSREDFALWRQRQKEPRMVNFYRWQRRRLRVLMNDDGKPEGGKWSFDTANRKPLPAGLPVPELPSFTDNRHVPAVQHLVKKHFDHHPGDANDFDLPTTRKAALKWLNDFLEQRFTCFGDYEDALTSRSDHVFHSVLSPLMNIGLLLPEEVLRNALVFAKRENIALNNVEGFVRQIIGWREFMFGIYCTDGDEMMRGNFWSHKRRLTDDWYTGSTGLLPLDEVINKANRIGWAHHIERLMVAGNLMLLAEIHPDDVYRWFMELFVDSAEWVMVPNVYGMALYADGGTITTKPYFCGSNYLRKMGDYDQGEWITTLDGLFWRFMASHRSFFEKQPRLGMLCSHLDRQTPDRREELATAAAAFLNRHTELVGDDDELLPPVSLTMRGVGYTSSGNLPPTNN
ncbi:MAG: cryptochrome/photolyase family protein, partial [Gammaproteobacteria bacterium]